MQPIKPKVYIVQNLLIALATVVAVFGFLFAQKTFNFHDALWGYLHEGEVKQAVYLGIVPLPVLAAFVSFIFVYLLFELYGFKSGFYGLISAAAGTGMAYGLTLYLRMSRMVATDSGYDLLLNQLFNHQPRDVLAWLTSLVVGPFIALSVAAALKRFTHNYFMFFRYLIAAPIGFAAAVGSSVFITLAGHEALRIMLLQTITPIAQFAGFTALSLPGLYVLRLIFGLFRGRLPAPSDSVPGATAISKPNKPVPAPKPKKTRRGFFKAAPAPTPLESPVVMSPPKAPTTAAPLIDPIKVVDLSECADDEVSISALFQNIDKAQAAQR